MTSTTSTSRGLRDCPISNTHQRLRQAHILWHQAAESYQNVDVFLTNVNSLIQELRNISFILQTEKDKIPGFDAWYEPWRERLKNDEYALWVKETRTLVVHQSALVAASHFNIKFLTYYELPVASLLTDGDSDLSMAAVLERKDFQSIVARIRYLMRDQGDAIIALERCWSTPELRGADLLGVLGTVYGLLARMVLDAHVHLGHLDCVENADTDSEFPTHRGRTALLPCMMREQAARTDYFSLNTFTPLSKGVRLQELKATVGDVEWRYQMKAGDRMRAYDSLDPVKLYEHMVWSSKRMLRKDRSLARIMMLRNGKGEWSSHMIMAGERVEKYLLLHLLAQTVREEGCDALVEVGETWLTDQKVSIPQLESIESLPNRGKLVKEAIMVRLDTRDGLHKQSLTIFNRGTFGGIKLSDTKEGDRGKPIYLTPIYQVWGEQNAYARSDGSRLPVWKPEYSEPCLCGSTRSFGTCCFPVLEGLQDVPMLEFETWLEEEKFEQAERHARASITRYGCWIRQHIPMFSDKSDGTYSEKMIALDCMSLEALFLKLESWASRTGNEEAVTDAYRRLEEIVGVPAIARRLVALDADWMLTNGKVEHGLLELGRLGESSNVTDSRALMLLAEYADQGPEETRRLFEKAVQCALDDDERCMCLHFFALELRKQGLDTEALDIVDQLLTASNRHTVQRGALTVKWEITESDEDFGQLLNLMKNEKENEGKFSAAAYLQSKDRPDAALEVLAELLEAKHPVAQLIAAECDIRLGNCDSAEDRLSTVKVGEGSIPDLRVGAAYLRAMLVLECGKNHLKDQALKRLNELSASVVTFDLPRLIEALEQHETSK
jgi:tetratricopeptide (TPR) repeat protein